MKVTLLETSKVVQKVVLMDLLKDCLKAEKLVAAKDVNWVAISD
jgi:hypothetical protein